MQHSRNNIPSSSRSQVAEQWRGVDEFVLGHVCEVLHKLGSRENKLDDEIWGKIILMKGTKQLAKAYLRNPVLIIDGSDAEFDGMRIGFNHFHRPSSDDLCSKINDGVIIKMDSEGNIRAMARGPTPVFLQGWKEINVKNCISKKLWLNKGKLVTKSPTMPDRERIFKVFDMGNFRRSIDEAKSSSDNKTLYFKSTIRLALVKDGGELNSGKSPCWLLLLNIIAIDMLRQFLPQTEIDHASHFAISSSSRFTNQMDSTLMSDHEDISRCRPENTTSKCREPSFPHIQKQTVLHSQKNAATPKSCDFPNKENISSLPNEQSDSSYIFNEYSRPSAAYAYATNFVSINAEKEHMNRKVTTEDHDETSSHYSLSGMKQNKLAGELENVYKAESETNTTSDYESNHGIFDASTSDVWSITSDESDYEKPDTRLTTYNGNCGASHEQTNRNNMQRIDPDRNYVSTKSKARQPKWNDGKISVYNQHWRNTLTTYPISHNPVLMSYSIGSYIINPVSIFNHTKDFNHDFGFTYTSACKNRRKILPSNCKTRHLRVKKEDYSKTEFGKNFIISAFGKNDLQNQRILNRHYNNGSTASFSHEKFHVNTRDRYNGKEGKCTWTRKAKKILTKMTYSESKRKCEGRVPDIYSAECHLRIEMTTRL
ncbi:MH2 domain-containing protein [Ditylenchus destructor]|nr:MH2 domain-containing protein [Ditylenchus destructor]